MPLEDTWGAMAELAAGGQGAVRRCLELRPRADRALRGHPARGLAAARVLHAGARRARPDRVVRPGRSGRHLLLTPGRGAADGRHHARHGVRRLAGRARPRATSPTSIGRCATVEQLRPVADRLGISLSQLALAWNVAQPGVTAAIAGSRNPEHVRDNAGAGDIVLDETDAGRDRAAPEGPERGLDRVQVPARIRSGLVGPSIVFGFRLQVSDPERRRGRAPAARSTA